jgi:GT2 family glycosyltransferase
VMNRRARLIAFYLPQYHPIPENDLWWGKGFTEWTNVVQANPLFSGHYQPRIPADLGFYDLRVAEARQAQAELAKEYCIYGFCYYHYWFNGKRLLNRPVDEVLFARIPDFPFCLCWANENWTQAWDGLDQNVLIRQNHSHEDDVRHIHWLVGPFRDPRYIRINGKPLFIVYRANILPDPLGTAATWRKEAKRLGIGDIYLAMVENRVGEEEMPDPREIGFDAAIEFQPDGLFMPAPLKRLDGHGCVFDYAQVVEKMCSKSAAPFKRFPCVNPGWDNSPRRRSNQTIIHDSTPQLYQKWLETVLNKSTPHSSEEDIVFVNAWNEWAEGAYLEPDQKWGRAYLEATRKALINAGSAFLDQSVQMGRSQTMSASTDNVDVSIIIPTYNKLAMTAACLDALQRNTHGMRYEIIVVDNNSTDGTVPFLRERQNCRLLRTILNAENQGFAKACNQGAAAATGRYLLFLNNDTEVREGWLDRLVFVLQADCTVGAAGSKLLFPDGTLQHAGIVIIDDRHMPDPLVARHIYYRQPGDLLEANHMRVYQALTAACLMVRASAFREVKGFDESYWNGYEDVDLCFKLGHTGWKIVYQPESIVIHHESQSGAERFRKVSDNISLLHKRWIGRINPDLIIEKDGTFVDAGSGLVRRYALPCAVKLTPSHSEALVSLVILTFNQFEYSKKCVESIRRLTPEPHEIIFVDNGSTDGSLKWLRQIVGKASNYKLIENGKNLGFAKGCNQGIAAASGEYILLLNNDVVVTENWLSGLLECLRCAPEVGIVGPMTNSVSGIQKVANVGYDTVDKLHEFARSIWNRYRHRRILTRRLVGFCMLFRRDLVDQIGLIDERFGSGNFEDDDFCLRAALGGYQNLIAGDVFIHHYGSASFIGNGIDHTSAMLGNLRLFNEKWAKMSAQSSVGQKIHALRSLEKANEFYEKGQLALAIESIANGIKHAPNEKALYYGLCRILIHEKRFQDALGAIQQLPHHEDGDLRAVVLSGYCKEGLGLPEQAQNLVDKALTLDPQHASALNLNGILACKRGQKDQAQELFKKSIVSDPSFGEPYTNMGVIKWGAGQREEAIGFLEKGFVLSPTVPDILALYCYALGAMGLQRRSEPLLRDASTIHPLHKGVVIQLIDSLMQQGKDDAALEVIQNALVNLGLDNTLLGKGNAARKRIGAKEINFVDGQTTLSLCRIIKNEDAYLSRCLASVKELVDEILVVDAGSTDKTRQAAIIFGAEVCDLPGTGDVSAAWNYLLSRASGEWLLVLDAYEVISYHDIQLIRKAITKTGAEKVAFSFVTRNYVQQADAEGWTANDGMYLQEEAGIGWIPTRKVRLVPRNQKIYLSNPHHDDSLETSLHRSGFRIDELATPVHYYGKLNSKDS